jgi:putative membrane protein
MSTVGVSLLEIAIICMMVAGPVLVLLILGLAVWYLRRATSLGSTVTLSGTAPETALDILKARYARGEITKEQFEQMRRDVE